MRRINHPERKSLPNAVKEFMGSFILINLKTEAREVKLHHIHLVRCYYLPNKKMPKRPTKNNSNGKRRPTTANSGPCTPDVSDLIREGWDIGSRDMADTPDGIFGGGLGSQLSLGGPGGTSPGAQGRCNDLFLVFKEVYLAFLSRPATGSIETPGTWTMYVGCYNKYSRGFALTGLSQRGAARWCARLKKDIKEYCADKAAGRIDATSTGWTVGDLYCGQEDEVCSGESVSQGDTWTGGAGATTGASTTTGGIARACSLQDAFDQMFPGQDARDGKGCSYGWIEIPGFDHPPTWDDAKAACPCDISELPGTL
jgi:hypothetical protein